MRPRHAFTVIELLTVLVIMGIVAAFALPKMGNMADRSQLRSAKDGISSRLAAARAAAIASGRTSTFYLQGDSMRVTVLNNGTEVERGSTVNLYRNFKVSMLSGNVSFVFDGRGMTKGSAAVIKFQRNSIVDSICVSAIGLINRHGCAQ
jgi:prepilin-type N-terminal cleavage/methylation domain-containing protein